MSYQVRLPRAEARWIASDRGPLRDHQNWPALGEIRHCGDGWVWLDDDAVMSLMVPEPGLLDRCRDGVVTWEGSVLVLVVCGEVYPLWRQDVPGVVRECPAHESC